MDDIIRHDIVYLVGHSARQENQLDDIIPFVDIQHEAGKNVGIVLMQDGVIGTSRLGAVPEAIRYFLEMEITVHALEPDMRARGINPGLAADKIHVIGYEDLVDIIADSGNIVSVL